MKRQIIYFILIFLAFIAKDARGQILSTYDELVNSIKSECKTTLAPFNLNCSNADKKIEEKLNAANIYLIEQLSKLYIADSSNLYQEKIKELTKLENQKPSNERDSLIQINAKEKLYLLTSLLSPNKSYSNFTNLIQLYYELSSPVLIPKNSFSFYIFRKYLYELLQNRFPEVQAYIKIQSSLKYNRIVDLTQVEFSDIDNEKKIIAELETLINELKSQNYKDKNYKDLLVVAYNSRALKVVENFKLYPSENLSSFIESIYSNALAVDPEDYRTNYNYGTFYFNQATQLSKSTLTNSSEKDQEIILEKIKELFIKAAPYLEKTLLKGKQ